MHFGACRPWEDHVSFFFGSSIHATFSPPSQSISTIRCLPPNLDTRLFINFCAGFRTVWSVPTASSLRSLPVNCASWTRREYLYICVGKREGFFTQLIDIVLCLPSLSPLPQRRRATAWNYHEVKRHLAAAYQRNTSTSRHYAADDDGPGAAGEFRWVQEKSE